LLSLLQNPNIMQQENLVIDVNCTLRPYANPTTVLGEALSGSVYAEAYARYITQPSRQLFVPIIQWIDRTHVTGNQRFSLKPYMFRPVMFTERFQRTIKAWRYHCFLPKVKLSSAQNIIHRKGNPIRSYHKQLRQVLSTFASTNERLQNITLPLGPTKYICVDIVACILFVIQDMQEGGMLCGQFGIQHHCCACNVDYVNLDNQLVQCSYLTADIINEIATAGDDETRKRWSQHCLQNHAFNYVPLANPICGIFGATPTETLHCFAKE
jgi:Plavaka transposase